MLNATENSVLLETIRNMHTELKLCGKQKNSLLNVSDNLLLYVLSLLRDEMPVLPNSSKSEWDELISILKPHRILPLLYLKIRFLPDKLCNIRDITMQMKKAFLWSRACCLLMERQLLEIVEAFNKSGISVPVLKGPTLARTMYPDPAARPSGDLDLLVCPEQMIQARNILLDLGYKCMGERFEISRDYYCDEIFIHQKENKAQVELHWTWHKFSGICREKSIHDIFKRTIEVKHSGFTFNAMHPVDNLIHCALHMSMFHNEEIRLIWIYDIALLFKYIDKKNYWKALQKSSDEWMANLALKHSLKMAQGWTGLKFAEKDGLLNWRLPREYEITTWSNSIQRHKI